MSDLTFNTVVLQDCLDRMRAGDSEAENDLIKAVKSRLYNLAARMFRQFPNVRGIADIDDLFQNGVMRLLRTVRKIKTPTTRYFMHLAAVHMRCELIDLARREKRRRTFPLNLGGSTDAPGQREPAAPEEEDMDEWVDLHKAVDRLPIEQREVVGLVLYHGWKQDQIAELLQVSVRTVGRLWKEACKRIKQLAKFENESE